MAKNRKPGPKTLDEFVEEQSKTLSDNVAIQTNEDGTVTVNLAVEDEEVEEAYEYNADEHYMNLVDEIDDDVLTELSMMVSENLETDESDRSEWMSTIEFGLDLLGVKVEEGNVPFEGACTAQHPLLMESSVKFQSKASNELLPAKGPVKVAVLGDNSTEREEQANRVKKHLNYQITELMTEFYPDSERMLLYVPLVGSGFKKTYYDAHLERPVSEFVTADQLVVPSAATDLMRAPRYTHILYKTKYELEADCASGLYTKPEGDIELGEPEAPKLTDVQRKTHELIGVEVGVSANSAVYTLYEQHVDCYIEGIDPYEGKEDYELASPYVITIDAATKAVLGVRRNWRKGDTKREKKLLFTHYGFVPGFGFYSFGYLHLLGNLQLSLTSSLRSLIDAGQFANLQGGFKLKGTRIVDDGSPIMPGQFKELDAMVQDVKKAIMPLPFKEPSQVLYQMLEFLDRKGQKFADETDQVLADATNYGPVGTTMALLDASAKFFSAIHKRLHHSLKQELKAIAAINAETLGPDIEYNIQNETAAISKEDYDARVDVVPASDPNISSSSHRMAKAQTILQVAQMSPEQHDMREVLKHFYINMDFENVDKILPPPEEAAQNDPMTDIQTATDGKPIKAFKGQDHKAHIALKQAFMQDPMSGGNMSMQQISIALQANIQEHMLLNFQEQVEAQAETSQSAPEQAAQQVAMMNQKQLQQEQEQQQGQGDQNKAAMMIAEAEMLDTQIQAKKQEFEELRVVAELELKKEKLDFDKFKEMHRSEEFTTKILAENAKLISTKGLDAMIDGLSQNIADKNQDVPKSVDKEE